MITGIKLQAHPTKEQRRILSQWMGCARFIWNAKCAEDLYLTQFAKLYLPLGTYPEVNQSYSQYKNRELTPWLFECPSQVLRNAASNWYNTHKNFQKGLCGKPVPKKKAQGGSILLTRELFYFEKCEDGVTRLWIGTKKNNIGYLSIKNHTVYGEPNSIRIKKKNGRYTVSFCYEDGLSEENLLNQVQYLEEIQRWDKEKLESVTVGIDRGVVIPVQAGDQSYDFTEEQKRKKKRKERYIRRCQRRLVRQKKGSNRRKRTKQNLAKAHEKVANIRKDFCHKASRSIVDNEKTKIIVLEDIRTSSMTKKPKPKKNEATGKWEKNNRSSKAGLNRSILDKGWYQCEAFIFYKAYRAGKAVFKIPAQYTSQECADCGHTHSSNRKRQDLFICGACGYSENADRNAAEVIKKRAIKLLLDSGTELSKRGVLLDSGCGAAHKTREAKATRARSCEASKKKDLAFVA